MSGFVDEYLPSNIRAYPWISTPRWSTAITSVASGSEHRNQNWKHPLFNFKAAAAVRCHSDLEDLYDHWMVMRGPLYSFPMRDPLDFASVRLAKANLEPTVHSTDQVIGIGDGVTKDFPLKKTYTRGAVTYVRNITLPLVETVLLAMNALPPETVNPTLPGGPYTWTVTREGGVVSFTVAPRSGIILTAGFLFDVASRFESDDAFDRVVKAYQVDGFADLGFMEVRPCNDEVAS